MKHPASYTGIVATVTVQGVAKFICENSTYLLSTNVRSIDFTIRRVRYWTVIAALLSIDDKHRGSGNRRGYTDTEIFIAYVLNILAEFSQPVDVLVRVGHLLRSNWCGGGTETRFLMIEFKKVSLVGTVDLTRNGMGFLCVDLAAVVLRFRT